MTLNNIASIEMMIGNYESALKCLQKGIKIIGETIR